MRPVPARPATYVDKLTHPFLSSMARKIPILPTAQSYLLKSWLDLAQVRNSLTVIKDAALWSNVRHRAYAANVLAFWIHCADRYIACRGSGNPALSRRSIFLLNVSSRCTIPTLHRIY